jgi:hypothetical protein
MANAKPENGKQAANPKQLLILAALFAVMVTVGVVQFGGLLSGGAPPAQNPAGQAASGAQPQANQTAQASENRITLPPLQPRDPFRPIIVAAKLQQEEPSRIVRTESTSRPKREIAGAPPLAPLTLPPEQFGLQPAENAPAPAPEPEQPHYTVTGVVQGPNSVAILVDKEGRRRFVKPGDPLEDGWRVVSIQRGALVLQKGKQRVTIRVGESTAPNGGNTP